MSAGARLMVILRCRELVAGVLQRRAHAVLALLDRALRQPDHGHLRQARGDVDLDLDEQRVDAVNGAGQDGGEHQWSPGTTLVADAYESSNSHTINY